MLNSPRLVALLVALLLIASAGSAAERQRVYTVLLDGPSVGQQLAAAKKSKAAPLAAKSLGLDLESRQLSMMPAFAETGAEVLDSVYNVLNAVFVRATREQAAALEGIDGVARVMVARPIRLYLDATSDLLQLPAAQSLAGGPNSAGTGIKIGVIDTGLDETHPAFDDAGMSAPAGFPKGIPADRAFTNNKIIAARSYVHLLNSEFVEFSAPDDQTPRDRIGHGTAVAMIAAGRAVDSPIGPLIGVAPKAFLGNYKIFGSPDIRDFSSEAALIAAIDDAATDGMDILTISSGITAQFPWDEFGTACGGGTNTACDPAALAAQTAVDGFGVVVVAAAGNAGDAGQQAYPMLNSISSPASAPSAIAVGASSGTRRFVQSLRYGGKTIDALAGSGPDLQGPLSAPVRDALTAGDQLACSPYAPGVFTGQIALIDSGTCVSEFKTYHAAQAGAVGVVIINSNGRDFPESIGELETLDIPTYSIGYTDGQDLIVQTEVGTVTATLDPALRQEPTLSDEIAFTSSRGPNLDGAIKPEIVAPGTSIYTAGQGLDRNGNAHTSDGFVTASGTSFSTPFVAGTAALILQRRPAFTVDQVRSALINTANPLLFDEDVVASVFAKGAGLLNPRAALETQAVVDPPTIGFGAINGFALPIQRVLTIQNLTTQTRTYTVEVMPEVSAATAEVEVDGLQITNFQLNPGSERAVIVGLTGTVPVPGIYEGIIEITNNVDAPVLVVPYAFTVGDGVAYNSLAIAGDGLVGTVGEIHPELLILKVVDQFGAPVANAPVNFFVDDGGGGIVLADSVTDSFGGATADSDMGPTVGFQDFSADIGDITVEFLNEGLPKPSIAGIVNGASFAAGDPVAPGSIASVFGTDLAEFLGAPRTLPLPIALKHVSFSFDFPETGLSVPAVFYFTSAGQLNIQVPWEFLGFNFALVKARIGDRLSNVFELELRDAVPGVFEFSFGGQKLAVATHADGTVITADNPARSGETIIVYGTGFGPVETAQRTGAAAPADGTLIRTLSIPQATIGGISSSVAFSGLAPGFVGLNQINIRIPATVSSGAQTLRFKASGRDSNEVTLWIE
jgi:minor extracellular serine protease Vpr